MVIERILVTTTAMQERVDNKDLSELSGRD